MIRLLFLILVVPIAACAPQYDAHYWRQYTWNAESAGYLKTDRNPANAPFSNDALAKNFSVIMFHGETHNRWTDRGSAGSERPLRRQIGPVPYVLKGNVSPKDRTHIADFVNRLSDLTGLKIYEVSHTTRLQIHFLDQEGRTALGETLKKSPGWQFAGEHLLGGMRGIICGTYDRYLKGERHRKVTIVIRDEVEGVLRQACIEEEIAHAFGPGADHPAARPSIFNDDQEYALLTEHDSFLFRVLYDPRLSNGITKAEGMPIVRKIIAELRPNG